jgi:crotonobetainyl-CoA:carnitine CoA-transferase CaiB-like acyl-CoA transferase
MPLAGLRVLDLTSWWAGPSGTGLLAALGAEVIHVESTTHPDGMRATGYMFGQPNWWEWGHMFVATNTNKLDLTLDLDQDRGLELLFELVEACDLVVENFAPRVAERWGLTWEAVHARNPSAVMVRMPAFGLSGPWRERVGFAQTMELLSGLAWVTGPLGGPPRIIRGPCDPIAGMHGAVAMLTALDEARRTGEGHFVEAIMIEGAVNCAAEQILEFTAYGQHLTRTGNRSPEAAPQGAYRCQGTEQWLAVSIATDEQWRALRSVLGDPDWARDAAFDHAAGRHAGHDALDERLAEWAAGQVVEEAVDCLVAAGVPAVVGWDPRVESTHPQLVARRLFESVPHHAVGEHPVPVLPLRWSGIDRWARTPTPLLGEHNRDVLSRILGLTDADIDALEDAAVIGTSVKT